MTDPAFATKWDFLFGQVLIGVDRSTGVFSGSEPAPGQQMVCVWTSQVVAEEALHVESWELRPILVRDLLDLLPPGIGVQVDPERTSGMTASAAYVAGLKPYVEPFPTGAALRVTTWDEIPDEARTALGRAADEHGVRELHSFMYTVDESPPIGCLAWVAEEWVAEGAVVEAAAGASDVGRSLEEALLTSVDPATTGVVTVRVLPLSEVPQQVREAIGDRDLLRPRRRARFWRR